MVVATRVDREHGVRETVEFFGSEPSRMAGTTHLPSGTPSAGVVVCPSICSDFLRNYRREVLLARDLAARGLAVQRFHYRGTGNSDGDPADVTFASMREDARAAAERLVETAHVTRVGFVGTRFGGAVAASVAAPGAPLVLVEPILELSQFFREGFRARMAHDAKERTGAPTTTAQITAELSAAGTVDVLGHSVDRALYETASSRTVIGELAAAPRPLLVVQLRAGSGLRPEYQRFTTGLRERGFDVDVAVFDDLAAWWFLDDQVLPTQESVSAVADWLSIRLSGDQT